MALAPADRVIHRVAVLACVLATGSAHAAPGFAVALTNDIEHAKITVADLPGQRDVLVVAWRDVPGVTPASGAMIYQADRGSNETHYFAIGGGGQFSLVERWRGRRGHGPWIGFDVISDDPKRPLAVTGDAREPVDVPALLAQYDAFEHIAAPGEARTVIDAAIAATAAQANRACGSQIAPKLAWKTFATPASARLAKQAVSILEAIEAACADKAYATAVRAVRELRVEYQADGGALRLERAGAAIAVRFSDTSFNPRETARVWLTDHL
jgi:hypothetical protein